MTATDTELMSRIATADRAAFETLFNRFAPRVLGLGWHLLRNRGDAEDVLQETFLRVWRLADRFDPARCQPDGWVLMIARCRAVDRLRQRRRPMSGEMPERADEQSPWDELVRQEGSDRIAKALTRLTVRQAEAIRLAFFGGLTHEQVAYRLGVPLGTVKTRIRQGLIQMRELLE